MASALPFPGAPVCDSSGCSLDLASAMASTRKIAVIGAGPNGLSALKVFRDYGYRMVLFEKEPSIGGIWNYKDDGKLYASLDDRDQRINSCYFSLTMNTSRRMSQYSDFPASDSLSAFMNHSQFLHYMKEYARHFRLEDHIKFNCTVSKVRPAKDISSTNRWEVHYKEGDAMKTELFDKVVIASGPYPNAVLPEYPGMDEFQGISIHSAQVRQDELFDGKRVLMVGGSYSAAEMVGIALKSKVKALYWSVSASPQVKNRWMFDRFPDASSQVTIWDESITRHSYFKNPHVFMEKFASWLQPITQREDEPQLRSPPDRLTITNTEDVVKGLRSGRMRKVPAVKRFSQQSVLLSDDSTLEKIDVVIFCTGFSSRFHFLDELCDLKYQREAIFYRHMLPAEKQLQGLAFVGVPFTLLASLFPTAEMQSRWLADCWATRSYGPNGALYSDEEIGNFHVDIQKRIDSLVPCESYNCIADAHGYIEALAIEIGCQPPDIDDLLSTDRELAIALLHGPLTGTQYRIAGPHSWAGAREYVIKTAREVLGKQWQDLLIASLD